MNGLGAGFLPAVASLLAPRLCEVCGARSPAATGICRCCRRGLTRARAANDGPMPIVSAFQYDDTVAPALMHRFKFAGAHGLAPWMASCAARAFRRSMTWPTGTVLCPVPLAPHRGRERGFNQAELLATAIGRRLGLPTVHLLTRTDQRGRQTDRGRDERKRASKSVFAPRATSAYLPVVIIDDVCTTGSTLEACRTTLDAHGHDVRGALTVFYTPSPETLTGSRLCSEKL